MGNLFTVDSFLAVIFAKHLIGGLDGFLIIILVHSIEF